MRSGDESRRASSTMGAGQIVDNRSAVPGVQFCSNTAATKHNLGAGISMLFTIVIRSVGSTIQDPRRLDVWSHL